MKKLEGKVAYVTGSGRGIGQAIAFKLASEGARLVVNDLDDEPANDTVAKVRSLGGDAVACPGDVTKPGFGERFIKTGVDRFGGVDIIVNNAGFPWDTVIQKLTDEQFQTMLEVHLGAPVRILRAASGFIIPAAKREAAEGRAVARKVVNISSISGLYGNAGQIAYSAGKAGITGATKALAKEWARYNVNVNCVAFGLIDTRMTKAIGSGEEQARIGAREIRMGIRPEVLADMRKSIPLGRAGTPHEAAGGVYLFCIPESNYITGQVLVVSGGFVM